MRRFLCSLVAAASAVPLALSGSGGAAPSNAPLIPVHPGQRLPLAGGTIGSTNWSGYVVSSKKHKITRVVSTFTVTRVSSPPSGFAAKWVGIGGFATNDLIQAGVAENANPSSQYFAWYELLPASETRIHHCAGDSACTVKQGDKVKVTINEVSSNKWKFTIVDSRHWTWHKTVSYHSRRDSAEWILEAPTVDGEQSTLPHVDKAFFGPKSTFAEGGAAHTIVQGKPDKILMFTSSGKREATPSALDSNGQSFDDCSWASSCAAP